MQTADDSSVPASPVACEHAHQLANPQRRSILRSVGRAFRTTAAASAAALSAPSAHATPTSIADVDPGALGTRLVSRITFGVTSEELALFSQLGYNGYLEYQLNHTAIPDTYVEDRLLGRLAGIPYLDTLLMTGEQLYAANNSAAQFNQLVESVLIRAVYSKRQLFERMVDFWSDHFNLDVHTGDVAVLKTLDDRDVIRPNALGNFANLLTASAQSPAMLNYLNNDLNTAGSPNENYAREILELHSISTSAGFLQSDVIAVSRCLTGWTRWDRSARPSNWRGTFRYDDTVHDQGEKVLSPLFNLTGTGPVVIPANQPPMKDGMDVLGIISRHPSTANILATKLCRRFIGEDCPTPLIAQVKAAYLNNGAGVVGDIKAMLRAMLKPNVLYSATPRWKRPLHLFASALRVVPVTINTTGSIRACLFDAGNQPFTWNPPDGYPDTTQYWSGQQIPRWNFAADLVPDTLPTGSNLMGVITDIGTMLAGANTVTAVMDRIDQLLFQGEMNPQEKLTIRNYLAASGFTQQARNEAVALALSSPGFQVY